MDDLRARIAARKRARRKKMFIRLTAFASVVAVIIIVCVSCNREKPVSLPETNITEPTISPEPEASPNVTEDINAETADS
ncbi:MAG: hypothetical protein KIG65_09915 [Eubacteriales bacterium]|nr:hypothetical protein [Eubacteriales bacterium]